MGFFKQKKQLVRSLTLFSLLITLSLFMACGGGEYDQPSTTAVPTAISSETLKSWIDSGKVNGTGIDRVVILDVTTAAAFSEGHIPGAQLVDKSGVAMTRSDGVIPAVNMILNGPAMDGFIQNAGIDGNTTMVITGPGKALSDYMSAGRAYWNLRYWGFPKERIKVLNGMNGAYEAAYGLTTDTAGSTPTPSTWSVRNNPSFRDDLRASMAEMMDVAAGKVPDTVVIDGRGATNSSYDGTPLKTTGVFNVDLNGDGKIETGPGQPDRDYVAFEGHIVGGQAMNYQDLYSGVDTDSDGVIDYYEMIGADEMAALLLEETGLTAANTAYVHCRTAMIASAMYIAMDSVLGRPVVNYDGSWSEWGSLAGTSNGGFLDDNSPWRADIPSLTANLTLNIDAGATIEDPATGGSAVNSFATSADMVETEDRAYFSGGGGNGGGATPGY